MSSECTWITPFVKQTFVTVGVSLNMMAHGMVMGFCTSALPQLKVQSIRNMDENSASWIASIVGFALIIGILFAPTSMNRFGRRNTNLISAAIMTSGWACISLATTVEILLLGRFLQGFAMGLMAVLGSMLIGEYTSPKSRGAFLSTISIAILSGVLLIHSLGAVLSWQKTALISMSISMIPLVLIVFSPESPSFLAVHGRYDECRKSFHWLRGYDEDEELEKMIKSEMLKSSAMPLLRGGNLRNKCTLILETLKKKEFYKPIILMLHVYTINEWCGGVTLDAYSPIVIHKIVGEDANVSLIITTADIQRIISNFIAMFVIKKVTRRLMLLTTVSMNVSAYLLSAGFVYMKEHGIWDNYAVGVLLIHFHMFTVSVGCLLLPNILAGEVFPLRYRGIGGMISILWFSMNVTINLKTAPYLFATIGLDVSYCIFAGIVFYCLVMSWWLLPETKDRTLQEIEEEFKNQQVDESCLNYDEETNWEPSQLKLTIA